MDILKVPSPNFGRRRADAINMILIHYTEMVSAEAAMRRLSDPTAEVSSHYLISTTGKVYQLVDEEHRAWHAGVARWGRHSDVNSHSIGIELDHIGVDDKGNFVPFPDDQISSLVKLMKDILGRHTIPARNIIGHSDVAPARKQDPGPQFPWRHLADHGIGVWPRALPELDVSDLKRGDRGAAVRRFQQGLRRYGYGLSVDGQFGPETATVVRAFQAHFRAHRVDGVGDRETQSILAALLNEA